MRSFMDILALVMMVVASSSAASYASVSSATGTLSDEILTKVEADRCTSIVVGKRAGTQGPMNTHTADCSDCDFRLNKVPARDWPAGSKRPLYLYKGDYPQTITSYRGVTWHPDNLEGTPEQLAAWGKESTITGYIPQVAHTYAIYEAGYGIMNEHQVAIGESTCASKLWAAPVTAGGTARIEVREMSQIALERSKTAREAIQIMGDLATQYGFYAADWVGGDASKGEGGEGLTVVDKEEAWVFHVLADDTGTSAVWAAQRLEPDHVAVIANQFVIRTIDPKDNHYLFSSNIWEVAKRNGFWKESDGLLDFLLTYGQKRAHSPYATRRVWRVFNLVAPSIVIPADTDALGTNYPFSVKVDKVISPEELMNIQRDHYEGTPYDLTQGLAAGPYGDPNRFDMSPIDGLTFNDIIQGSYERSISLFRTSYSFVAIGRASVPDELALLWFSQHAPSGSSYVPFYVASRTVPTPYSRGSLFKYDDNIAFWNFVAAANYAARFYKFAMRDVRATQKSLFDAANAEVQEVEKEAIALLKNSDATTAKGDIVELLTQTTNKQVWDTVKTWKNLLPQLITKYHDGYEAKNLTSPNINMKKLFYPKSWLDATGYWNNKPNQGPDVILFAPNPNGGEEVKYMEYDAAQRMAMVSALASGLLAVVCTLLVVFYYNKKQASSSAPMINTGVFSNMFNKSSTSHQYQTIPGNDEEL